MQLFGGVYDAATGFSLAPCPGGECPDPSLEPKPRYHFDYFGPAMITCFVRPPRATHGAPQTRCACARAGAGACAHVRMGTAMGA